MNHQCLIFNYCGDCKVHWCGVCRKCKCPNIEYCCGDYRNTWKCQVCNKKVCTKCVVDIPDIVNYNFDYSICFDCSLKVCPYCESVKCDCRSCVKCGIRTRHVCGCGNKALCIKCKTFGCSDKCVISDYYKCPNQIHGFSFNKHRCPECYNVFIDRRPKTKNKIKAALICLRPLPRPIRLLICSLMAKYKPWDKK